MLAAPAAVEASAPESPAEVPAEPAPEGNKLDSLLIAYYNNPDCDATAFVGYSIATWTRTIALMCY